MNRFHRPMIAVCLALTSLIGVTACGSSSKNKSSDGSPTTAASGAPTSTPSKSGSKSDTTKIDPCSLFSTEAMAEQMGADDVTSEKSDLASPTCTYRSETHYLSAELAVLDKQQFANTPRDPSKVAAGQSATSVELLDVSGIGDEVFGYTMHGGVSLVTRSGDTGYSLLLTNAGGGSDAGSWVDDAAMVTSAKTILTKVVAAAK